MDIKEVARQILERGEGYLLARAVEERGLGLLAFIDKFGVALVGRIIPLTVVGDHLSPLMKVERYAYDVSVMARYDEGKGLARVREDGVTPILLKGYHRLVDDDMRREILEGEIFPDQPDLSDLAHLNALMEIYGKGVLIRVDATVENASFSRVRVMSQDLGVKSLEYVVHFSDFPRRAFAGELQGDDELIYGLMYTIHLGNLDFEEKVLRWDE